MASISTKDVPIQTIFTLILIISANFLAQLFPCRIQTMLRDDMFLKHFFGLLTMLFFSVLAVPDMSSNLVSMTLITIILYVWFILITKVDVYFFITIVTLLLFSYLLNMAKTNVVNSKENEESGVNKEKGENKENKETEKNEEKIKTYEKYQHILFIVVSLLTVSGTLLYMGEKKIEYKSKFNYLYFFLGKPSCKNNSPEISYKNAAKYMFS